MAKKRAAITEKKANHKDWIQLLDISGPFPSPSQWKKAYESDALDRFDTPELKFKLREARHQWRSEPTLQSQRHWLESILKDFLELGKSKGELLSGSGIDARFRPERPGGEAMLQPSYVLVNSERSSAPGQGRLLIHVTEPRQALTKATRHTASAPRDQMVDLCRLAGVPLGLLSNGEDWMLIHAPVGETSTFVSWDATLWVEEPLTFNAFVNLLHADRFFVQNSKQTETMFKDALSNQFELTDELGRQVREAVEILIRRFSLINPKDHPYHAELLEGFSAEEIYRGTLTLMMRLVVVLCAEERGLFPLHDDFYREHYALSTMLDQLQHSLSQRTADVLQRQYDAWHRLLATFRLIYDGVRHDRFSFRGYGSTLFDPDKAPFLEGRRAGTKWKDDEARPLPVDNLTILRVLQKLQMLGIEGEARLLSFRALDPEQIGYVYEGLLDHTAQRTSPDEVVLGIVGPKRSGKGKKKQDQEPEVPLSELEALLVQEDGAMKVVEHLSGLTGRSVNDLATQMAINTEQDSLLYQRLRTACDNREALYLRIEPFAQLLRKDEYGLPFVVLPGRVYVTEGLDRRSSGAHYTPRFLCEEVVRHTLDSLVYVGPAEGKPESEWQLMPPHELLALKICDIAMGSGAFLVQACRYLSEKLVRAWEQIAQGQHEVRITPYGEPSRGLAREELIPLDPEDQLIYARHLVVTHCLYGVDKNPMAVEMAKLSLWLITLDPHQPFTFLDSHLRCGDSLLGITDLAQLENFHLHPEEGKRIHKFKGGIRTRIQKALERVTELRKELENAPELDLSDMRRKAELYEQTQTVISDVKLFADYLVGVCLQLAGKKADEEWEYYGHKLDLLLDQAGKLDQERAAFDGLKEDVQNLLGVEPISGKNRQPFHWVLEFPEVLQSSGFSALVGNPPYFGGPKLTGTFGNEYRDFLVEYVAHGQRGAADLCAYFVLRTVSLMSRTSNCGLIVTSSIAEGDTRTVGLQQLIDRKLEIFRATSRAPWPGKAKVTYSTVWLCPYNWKGALIINNSFVSRITAMLSEKTGYSGQPNRLNENSKKSFNGAKVYGNGFIVSYEKSQELMAINSQNKLVLFPYITTKDLNSHAIHKSDTFAIRFFDWPLNRATAPKGYTGPVAADYPECLEIVERLVKPERDKNNREARRKNWWKYGEQAKGLYEAISSLNHVLAVGTQATKYVAFAIIDKDMVFSHSLSIIADDSFETFAVLNCSIHEIWARSYGGYNLALLRYSPTDLLETFPFPPPLTNVEDSGRSYHEHRRNIMIARQEGLTEIYNFFHDPSISSQDIVRLRKLHLKMDQSVALAYGWQDLNLNHGFYETKQGIRFTISEAARQEVLDRLLELNHQRYALEQAENNSSASNQAPDIRDSSQSEVFHEQQLSLFS